MPNFRISDFRATSGYVPPHRNEGLDGIATPRELVFSLLIVGVLVALGFLVHHCIVKKITDHNLKIQQAIQVKDDGQFAHCLATSPGDAICEGDLDAVSPVTDEKGHIKGEFWSIVREYQVYTEHTRIVHYTTGSGKNIQHHTRVEHYWTWDTHDTHKKHCRALRFCGVELPLSKIDLGYWPDGHSPVSIGYHKRYVYHTIPKHHHGSVYTSFLYRTMKDGSSFYPGMSPSETAEHLLCGRWPVVVFWIVASVFIAFVVFWFCMIDNSWLESVGKPKTGIDIGSMIGQ